MQGTEDRPFIEMNGVRKSVAAIFLCAALLTSGCASPPRHGRMETPSRPAPSNRSAPPPSSASPPSDDAQIAISRGEPVDTKSPAVPVFPVGVTRTADGDTIEVRWVGAGRDKLEKVRLIGVDAPELSHPDLGIKEQPGGREAAAYTRRILMEQRPREVLLEFDAQERDKHGRLLAYVWLSYPRKGDEAEVREKMLNARLLLDGHARIMTVPPNVRYADLFRKLQAEAREAGRGLWGSRAHR